MSSSFYSAEVSQFPASLHTSSPVEGHALARRLAADLNEHLATPASAPATMAEMLRTPAEARPSPHLITAIYFHAISLANAGWKT